MSLEQLISPLLANWPSFALLLGFENHTALRLDPAALQSANTRLDSLFQSTDRKTAARDHVKALNTRNA